MRSAQLATEAAIRNASDALRQLRGRLVLGREHDRVGRLHGVERPRPRRECLVDWCSFDRTSEVKRVVAHLSRDELGIELARCTEP